MKVKHTIKVTLWCLLLMLLAFAGMASSQSDTGPATPEQVIHQLQSDLLQAMQQGEKLDYEGRYHMLEPAIDRSHDIELIIKTILGATYWSQLDKEQQDLIVDTFRQLTIATYAGQFNQYGGEQFQFIEQRALPHEQMLVRSQLIQSDGGVVNFDYVLHQAQGHWRIINILFDGVSDLAIKRGEYRAILQRSGFNALIEMLKEKKVLAQKTSK